MAPRIALVVLIIVLAAIKYRLTDLYSTARIEKIGRSVSSIWWRCLRAEPNVERNITLQVDDTLGGRFTFHLEDGAHTYEAGVGGCYG
jgi:hypothetical protein